MEVKSTAKWIRTGPRKLRKYADVVRQQSLDQARGTLTIHPSPAAKALLKVINSAVANAENNHGLDAEDLRIKAIMIDEAMKLPRLRCRARGRADRYYHRSCHIAVVVTDEEAK
ncbi:MAG TPA: 50S ribosomal protein L22 [Armatimonadota bacterium]|jgi:large subunit ribosomal protein L22